MKIVKATVRLLGVVPEVVRTLEVQDTLRLKHFHECLQLAMGWRSRHTHSFHGGGREWDGDSLVSAYVEGSGAGGLVYVYDHGDCWEHSIEIGGFKPPVAGEAYPKLTGVLNRCPPEDCGGPDGYRDVLAQLADPDHPEHAGVLDWLKTMELDGFGPLAADVKRLKVDVRLLAHMLAGKQLTVRLMADLMNSDEF